MNLQLCKGNRHGGVVNIQKAELDIMKQAFEDVCTENSSSKNKPYIATLDRDNRVSYMCGCLIIVCFHLCLTYPTGDVFHDLC